MRLALARRAFDLARGALTLTGYSPQQEHCGWGCSTHYYDWKWTLKMCEVEQQLSLLWEANDNLYRPSLFCELMDNFNSVFTRRNHFFVGVERMFHFSYNSTRSYQQWSLPFEPRSLCLHSTPPSKLFLQIPSPINFLSWTFKDDPQLTKCACLQSCLIVLQQREEGS